MTTKIFDWVRIKYFVWSAQISVRERLTVCINNALMIKELIVCLDAVHLPTWYKVVWDLSLTNWFIISTRIHWSLTANLLNSGINYLMEQHYVIFTWWSDLGQLKVRRESKMVRNTGSDLHVSSFLQVLMEMLKQM